MSLVRQKVSIPSYWAGDMPSWYVTFAWARQTTHPRQSSFVYGGLVTGKSTGLLLQLLRMVEC